MEDHLSSKILDFESNHEGASPSPPKMLFSKKKITIFYNRNFFKFSILKIQHILFFVDKKNKKKLINLFSFISQIKMAILKKRSFFIFYKNKYIIIFLNLLKKFGLIFNYFLLCSSLIFPFLYFSKFYFFISNLLIIFFRQTLSTFSMINKIKLLSKPSRYLYISFKNLTNITTIKNNFIFFLNTNIGIMSHFEALRLKIGGNLLCLIY